MNLNEVLSSLFTWNNFSEIVKHDDNIDFTVLLDTLQFVNIEGLPPGGGLASK